MGLVVGSPMRSIALRACGGFRALARVLPPASWNQIGYFDDETCRLEPMSRDSTANSRLSCDSRDGLAVKLNQFSDLATV